MTIAAGIEAPEAEIAEICRGYALCKVDLVSKCALRNALKEEQGLGGGVSTSSGQDVGQAVLLASRLLSKFFANFPASSALYNMVFYRRRLPHWQPEGEALFVTWRLHGTLPPHRYAAPQGLTTGQAFVWMDRYLDQARYGPCWLRQERLARLVDDAIHYGAGELAHYQLHACVVMPNHVHVLLLPLVAPSKLLHSLKGFTAREANRLLRRTGQPFWQRESYDHWIRNQREWERVKACIEDNPVKTGLASQPEDYRWSSAFRPAPEAGLKAGSQAGLLAPLHYA